MRRLAFIVAIAFNASLGLAQKAERAPTQGPEAGLSVLVGRPTDRSAVLSVLSSSDVTALVEFGTASGKYESKSPKTTVRAGTPTEIELAGLRPDTEYFYRLSTRAGDQQPFMPQKEQRFHTARKAGGTFSFAVQGDSHPERPGRMYDPDLYVRTLENAAASRPDFYFMMGDDFSIERLFEQNSLSQAAVNAVYAHQRGFVGIVGRSAPLMLVNGNHEQAAKYLLDGTAHNGAVFAGKARTSYFPLPAPETDHPEAGFYTGDAVAVEHVGLVRDYYAWEWGDALFVVIDPYWHSDVAVDNQAGSKAPRKDAGRTPKQQEEGGGGGVRRGRGNAGAGADGQGTEDQPAGDQSSTRRGKGARDLWQITLGDEQYQWLRKTLQGSRARFKFVFSHHVLGTGRGGIEQAGKFEWGGEDNRGIDRFTQMRPSWEQPIHDLMRDAGVTIFFQGHDHLYARQELDGVIYQSCPNPADPTFTAFNREAYKTGDILPNSGYLRVTVHGGADAHVHVEYVRCFRTEDEKDGLTNGMIAHSYTVAPREVAAGRRTKPESSR